MPSRPITLVIVLLWLTALGWMVYRELWQKAGQPPSFTLDLADEVGAQLVSWEIEQNHHPAGSVTTTVKRTPERIFHLNCVYKPHGLTFRGLAVRELASTYRATSRGVLRGLNGRVTFAVLWGLDHRAEIEGFVEGGFFRVRTGSGQDSEALAVAANGKVFNPLHPLHRLKGLSEGMTWRVPLLDLLTSAVNPDPAGPPPSISLAEARVRLANLPDQDREVPCWCVEYHQGERVAARVWARADDGTVLRQEALYPGNAIVLLRRLFK
ncbi:MAG: hypothetical protein L0Z62_12400 [Gemmataceae bacterium]|nr:hypothetical protein [Gemmataceae bacterium]